MKKNTENEKDHFNWLPILVFAGIVLLFLVLLTKTPLEFGCKLLSNEFGCHANPTVVAPSDDSLQAPQTSQKPRLPASGASITGKLNNYDVKATPEKAEPKH